VKLSGGSLSLVKNTCVLFFGQLAETFGRFVEVDLPEDGCTIAELRRRLGEGDPLRAEVLDRVGVRASVEQQVVREDTRIQPGQEIAFFPIVSGG